MSEYSLLSGTYDLLLAPFLRRMRKRILDIVLEFRPESIIDLCCGTGHQLKLLKKNGFDKLTCVDLSEEMLRTAGKGPYAPDCLCSDAEDTGLPTHSADLVIISLALHEKTASKAASVLEEARRIMKPGAVLVIADYTAEESVPFFAAATVRFIEFLVGGEHFLNYREYMRRGALAGLYDDTVFRVSDRYPAASGAISVEVWEKL